jgi:CubicO group peptidase (beta-lactamase class C family)
MLADATQLGRVAGMRSFTPQHVIYRDADHSQYRQFVIFMSASDLARFGAVYVQGGRWQVKQIIPEAWVAESLTTYSSVNEPRTFDGYGYLWWIDSRSRTAWADGWRGQYLIVDRERQLVIVSRNDTGRDAVRVLWAVAFGKDGFRDHHQKLPQLTIEALSGAPR